MDDKTNNTSAGGPLGCWLGAMIGIFLSLAIPIVGRVFYQSIQHVIPVWLSLSLTIKIATLISGICLATTGGRIGWIIGQKLYREYGSISEQW